MATKLTTVITYFFVGMNAGAWLLQQAGLDHLLGIGIATGAHERTQQVANSGQSVPVGKNIGSTLIGMYTAVTDFITGILTYIFPAMDALYNVGVPEFWIVFISTVAGVAFAFDAASFIRGVRL